MFESRDLRLILAIHEHGSLVRAARVLGLAQPAVTRSLAALEAKLRGPLFERGPRGTIATDLGRALVGEAREILARMEALERHLVAARGAQLRDLAVVAGAYIGESLGVMAASRMLAAFPTVRLRLNTTNWADVPRAVLEREAAIGLLDLRGVAADPRLELERLRPQPAIFVVRPGHPLSLRPCLALEDIMAHPFILIGRVPREVQGPMVVAREEARARGAVHPAFPALVHESPSVALSLAMQSDAVAAVTVAIAAPALRAGHVVALPWRAPWVSVHPGILRLRDVPADEAERGFLDLLRAADRDSEAAALAFCAELGLSADCG
jgi:DNA-binding transcriptional LysR family regulator